MKTIYTKELHHAGMWSQVIGRGKTLRLTTLGPDANVGMLLYNADNLTERYNMPDTLKGQHVFFLTAPLCLHSDMGRILASITADTCGWHDTVCGATDEAAIESKYESKTFQVAHNNCHRNARDSFLVELGKWGLGARDLVPNLNLFSKVVSDDDGKLHYVPDHCKEGDSIDLRMEMKTLVDHIPVRHPFGT